MTPAEIEAIKLAFGRGRIIWMSRRSGNTKEVLRLGTDAEGMQAYLDDGSFVNLAAIELKELFYAFPIKV